MANAISSMFVELYLESNTNANTHTHKKSLKRSFSHQSIFHMDVETIRRVTTERIIPTLQNSSWLLMNFHFQVALVVVIVELFLQWVWECFLLTKKDFWFVSISIEREQRGKIWAIDVIFATTRRKNAHFFTSPLCCGLRFVLKVFSKIGKCSIPNSKMPQTHSYAHAHPHIHTDAPHSWKYENKILTKWLLFAAKHFVEQFFSMPQNHFVFMLSTLPFHRWLLFHLATEASECCGFPLNSNGIFPYLKMQNELHSVPSFWCSSETTHRKKPTQMQWFEIKKFDSVCTCVTKLHSKIDILSDEFARLKFSWKLRRKTLFGSGIMQLVLFLSLSISINFLTKRAKKVKNEKRNMIKQNGLKSR